MQRILLILGLLLIVLAVPFVLRDEEGIVVRADDTVIVVTPHTESIRQEFGRAFAKWYREQTGRSVYVDFRVIGGTSDIVKFLDGAYTNSFRNYWTGTLGRPWGRAEQLAFINRRIVPDATPEDDTAEEAVRRAFLESDVSCGIDIFFGGGAYDFTMQAEMGTLVDSGLMQRRPEWFVESASGDALPTGIPRVLSGEQFYDAQGRWIGAVLSSYGIIFNRDALRRIGFEGEPDAWADLADPVFFGEIGVCDPTKSGSMTQAFEMIIQQQMQIRFAELKAEAGADVDAAALAALEARAVREGWDRGMRLVQLISANARYFSDSSQKPNIDVAIGDCAAGMSIDFYGRYQQENIMLRDRGDDRFGFIIPAGGSTISADPIGLLRGAPNRAVAEKFIEFVLSLEGQKLWNFKVGAPGGPEQFPLRRMAVRPEIHSPEFAQYNSDPDFNPYLDGGGFVYHREWTGRLFSEIRTIIRICFIDVRSELVDAWRAIIEARREGRHDDAERAFAVLTDLSRISYDEASTTIDAALKAPRIEEVRLASELSEHFAQQYRRAQRIAEGR